MRAILDLLFRLKRFGLRVTRLRTRGVKVMLLNQRGEVLLIRNSYGRTDLFVLPGGGIRPFEQPAAAARREVREELGCEVENLRYVSTHLNRAEGKRDKVILFRATPVGAPAADCFEVEEARFFSLNALPGTVSAATLRRIDEHRGKRKADGRW